MKLHIKALFDLADDAANIRLDLRRWYDIVDADEDPVPSRRQEKMAKIVRAGLIWGLRETDAAELEALFQFLKEAARINVASRSAAFRAKHSISIIGLEDAP